MNQYCKRTGTLKIRIVPLLIALVFLTACSSGKSNTEPRLNTVENAAGKFAADFEKCSGKDYVNLDFSKCSARFPDFTDCYNMEISVENQAEMTDREMYYRFKKYCNFFLEDYRSENMLFSCPNEDKLYNEAEDDGNYAWYPKVDNYKKKINDGAMNIDSLIYRDTVNNHYLWWIAGQDFPNWVNKGEIYDLVKTEDSKVSSWIPSDITGIVAEYFNDGSHKEEKYPLLDGEVSIGEAVEYFENEYLKGLPYSFNKNYSVAVSSVAVFEAKKNVYGYLIRYSSAWKGIPFDRDDEYYSDNSDIVEKLYTIPGEAIMVRRNDIDVITDLNFPKVQEKGDTLSDMYSLESAVDIVSEKLTHGVRFGLQTIEFIYRGTYNDERTKIVLEPSWKFVAFNPKDNLHYCIYVSATNGECSYYSYSTIEAE